MVVALAGAAGVAIENARLHQRLEQVAVLAERERIARDLHDTVIQRLFATGMGLQSLVGRMEESDLRVRLQQAVDELDETIREIRITIFDLEARDAEKDGLRTRVLSLTGEATATLGFAPKVHMDGPLEAATVSALRSLAARASVVRLMLISVDCARSVARAAPSGPRSLSLIHI